MKEIESETQFTPLEYNLGANEKKINNRTFNKLYEDLKPKNSFNNFRSQNPEVNFHSNNNSNIEFLRKNYQNKNYRCKKNIFINYLLNSYS